ncbi:glycoside hydrolase family 113 [Kitasatospora sp. NPDC101157]|uniref:glycoside hydrolase family 113 n=1 Tax=Kitasatospora sp. NPDC101157 TaxID=3364098 RepID=UPI0037FC1F93
MKRPAIFVLPTVVLGITVVVPVVWGDHPIRFDHRRPTEVHWAGAPTEQGRVWGFGKDEPAAPADTGPKVARPWTKGSPEWGVQVYWLDDPADPDSFVQGKVDRIVKYVVGLNANSLSVTFPYYTTGTRSNAVAARPTSPSPERLALLLDAAHRAGLRTTVRPIMDEEVFDYVHTLKWRGNITPTDRDAWFASYAAFLAPYLKTAQDHSAAAFTIGTEFNSLEGDPHWQDLIVEARKTFHGELEYDANFDNWAKGAIAVPADGTGADAYPPAKNSDDDAPIADLEASWNAWLDHRGKGPQPTTKLTEVGIPAQNGAYKTPGEYYKKTELNETVQATWFTAVCQVAQQRKLRGVYFWSLYFGIDPTLPTTPDTPRMDYAGRPKSEKAIRDCFAQTYEVPQQ